MKDMTKMEILKQKESELKDFIRVSRGDQSFVDLQITMYKSEVTYCLS